MGRQLGIALALLIVLFALGYGAYALLFSEEKKARTDSRAVAVADAGPVARVADATIAPVAAERAVVSAITGTLERKTTDGEWAVLAIGDEVYVNDALRTVGPGASAIVTIGDAETTLQLFGEFTMPTLSAELSTVQIMDGRLEANVASAADTRLRVSARGSDAVAETRDGKFSVMSTGDGDVAVASKRGQVDLSAAGRTVTVAEGQQSVVNGEGPPSPPETLPSSLLLKIGQTARELRVKETIVRGTTTPGAIINVGGSRVQADEHGEFETKVKLKEGRNRLTVVVEDVLGQQKSQKLPALVVDSRAPDSSSDVTW